jgi:diguanylate cyclase (GGDEF)-like protein
LPSASEAKTIIMSADQANEARAARGREPKNLPEALARVAALEARNEELAEKIAEMSFLLDASALLGSTLDEIEIVQAALETVPSAIEDASAGCFIALLDGSTLACAAARRADRLDAERFIAEHAGAIRASLTGGTAHVDENGGIVVPIFADRDEPGLGVLVVGGSAAALTPAAVRRLKAAADLTGKSLANARLFAQTIVAGVTDELTGVFNRRYLDRRLGEELKRAHRLGEPCSIVLLDLDFFKAVNDEHGHQEGDRVLCAVARTIVECVREIDLVTRWGGEEFAVLIPGTTAAQALLVTERIRTAIERLVVSSASGAPLRITVSCGVAWVAPHIHTPAQCIAAADRCLLEAKRLGRNRTIAMKAG